MGILQKTTFKWNEPRSFVKIRDGQKATGRRWWSSLPGVLGSAAAMLLIWFLATLNPRKTPPPFHEALSLSILFGIFMGYGVPWMIRLCPSQVRLTEKFLLLMRGNRQRMVMWKDVRAHRFDKLENVDVLQLALQNGGALAIGLDKTVKAEEIGRFLAGVGVPRNEDA